MQNKNKNSKIELTKKRSNVGQRKHDERMMVNKRTRERKRVIYEFATKKKTGYTIMLFCSA
jgi:peptide methionine sulfoxide reductase MsrB